MSVDRDSSAPPAGSPSVSIVIVSFNSKPSTLRCLESLHQSPPTVALEMVLVDNASTDGTVDAIRPRWPDVRIIQNSANLGFGAASNLGVSHSRGDLILFLNSDTSVPAGAIDALVAELVAHPEAAAVGPLIVDPDGRPELSFGDMVGPASELTRMCLARAYDIGWTTATRRVQRMTSSARTVDWASAACLLAWRSDLEGVGGFDEQYFLYFEDVDLCAALRARGRRILFAPVTRVVHERGGSARSVPAIASAAYRRSQLSFYAKHHPRWLPALRAYLTLTGRLPNDR